MNSSQVFQRNIGAITNAQQEKLQNSTVAVIGCGGLGGYVIEELARLGVGALLAVDFDQFSPSNLNRQLNALKATIGTGKAESAAKRVAAIHPYTQVKAFAEDFRLLPENALLAADVIVDCLDSLAAREDLFSLCHSRGLPLVHGAVNGWFGQVGVQLPGFELFSTLYPRRSENPQEIEPPSVLSFTVATIASFQVAEVTKLLLELSSPLHNTFLTLDIKDCEWG